MLDLQTQKHTVLDNYGYINARVRAMKSVLLGSEFYEELLKVNDFSGLMGLLEKTPYKQEIQECAISHTGIEGIDEALKRNLSRTFRRILDFAGGEANNLILVLLGRWDVRNIITILRGIHIDVSSEQILESLIPAGELDMPLLTQLANESNIKGCINILATWGSPYARILNEKYAEYMEEKDLSILELALDKAYYINAMDRLKGVNVNFKIMKDLIVNEIDAINVTTILRLQKLNIEDLIYKRKAEKEEIKEEVKTKPKNISERIKKIKEDINLWWQKMTAPIKEEGDVSNESEGASQETGEKTVIVKDNISFNVALKRFLKNSERLIKTQFNEKYEQYRKSRENLYEKISMEKNIFKKIWLYLNSDIIEKKPVRYSKTVRYKKNVKDILTEIKNAYKKIEKIVIKAKKVDEDKKDEEEQKARLKDAMRRERLRDFFITGGKQIKNADHFVDLCLNLDVEKVVKELEKTSFGVVLKSVLERYLEFNALSILERKIEEQITLRGVAAYNKGPLCIGIPIGYIWKKYNEVVNLRIIMRCKKIGMPDRKIREELVIV
ncbi:MAG: V-type ATPase subunit [Candidatus Firestonebacteria bacterium]|nr:V-type ATPase subunit [Candidatus Firestonebacteria bacterium]